MSQTNIAITQLAQVGLAERIAQEAQGHPEVTRQAAQQAAPETLKRQEASVAPSEKPKDTSGIKAEKDGRNSRQDASGEKKKQRNTEEQEPERTASASPWSGNILNVKV